MSGGAFGGNSLTTIAVPVNADPIGELNRSAAAVAAASGNDDGARD